jgi:hypothetical protein
VRDDRFSTGIAGFKNRLHFLSKTAIRDKTEVIARPTMILFYSIQYKNSKKGTSDHIPSLFQHSL